MLYHLQNKYYQAYLYLWAFFLGKNDLAISNVF